MLIKEVPGKLQPSLPAPTGDAGLMQLHRMAQIPRHISMHMSRYQQHQAQVASPAKLPTNASWPVTNFAQMPHLAHAAAFACIIEHDCSLVSTTQGFQGIPISCASTSQVHAHFLAGLGNVNVLKPQHVCKHCFQDNHDISGRIADSAVICPDISHCWSTRPA